MTRETGPSHQGKPSLGDGTERNRAAEHITRRSTEVQAQSEGLAQENGQPQRQAEALELARSTALFPEENPFPVLRASSDGTLLFANRSASALLAEWRCELGHRMPEFVQRAVARALDSKVTQELEIGLGQRSLSFILVPIAERNYVNFYGSDVTERKRAQEQVQRQMNELRKANDDLARFNRIAVGRELRMIELKKEINALCARLGQPPPYAVASPRESISPHSGPED